MTSPQLPMNWSPLLKMMNDRFSGLTDQFVDSLKILLDAGREALDCAEVALMVPTSDGTHLRFLVSVNSRPEIAEIISSISVPCDRSIAGYVFNTGQSIAVSNPEDFYPVVDQKTGLTTRVYLAAPVLDNEEVLGVATYVNRPEGRPQEPFTKAEIDLSEELADLAAVALKYHRRLRHHERLFHVELVRAAGKFGTALHEPVPEDSGDFPADEEDSPSVRALLALECLSSREQDLAADIIALLSSYAGEWGAAF